MANVFPQLNLYIHAFMHGVSRESNVTFTCHIYTWIHTINYIMKKIK